MRTDTKVSVPVRGIGLGQHELEAWYYQSDTQWVSVPVRGIGLGQQLLQLLGAI